jgi:hypothetical protein
MACEMSVQAWRDAIGSDLRPAYAEIGCTHTINLG